MTRLKLLLSSLVQVAAIFTTLCLGMFLLKAREAGEQVRVTVADADKVAVGLQTTVAKSNDALFKQYGIADETRKTLKDLHDAAGQAAVAERDYYQKTLKPQTSQMFTNLNTALSGLDAPRLGNDLHGTFVSLNKSLDQMPELMDSANDTLQALNSAITDVDQNLINDPEIKESLKQIAGILGNVNLTTADVHLIVEHIRHSVTDPPTKKQKILAILEMVYKAALIKVALGH